MTMPPSQVEKPGSECPPPRTATSRFSLRAKSTARMTSATPAHWTISAGRWSCAPFQIDARLVIALVLGPDELSAQALLELAERRLAEHVRDGRFRRHVFELLLPRCTNAVNARGWDLATA